MKRCPLLVKYNFPFNFDSDKVSRWYRAICDHCPLKDACIEDWESVAGKKLKTVMIPCPHCGATDVWQHKEEDGISCYHCGERIYHSEGLPWKSGGMGKQIK